MSIQQICDGCGKIIPHTFEAGKCPARIRINLTPGDAVLSFGNVGTSHEIDACSRACAVACIDRFRAAIAAKEDEA